MEKKKSRKISELALLMGSGAVLKLLTDIVFRTVLFALLFDPFILINSIIFTKYSKAKDLTAVILCETCLTGVLFTTTDLWFIRPLTITVTFLTIKILRLTKVTKDTKIKQYQWEIKLSSAITSYFSVLIPCLISILIIFFLPSCNLYQTFYTTVEGMVTNSSIPTELIQKTVLDLRTLIVVGSLITGLIYSFVPALFSLGVSSLVCKWLGDKQIAKQYYFKEQIDTEEETEQ